MARAPALQAGGHRSESCTAQSKKPVFKHENVVFCADINILLGWKKMFLHRQYNLKKDRLTIQGDITLLTGILVVRQL